MSHEAKEYHCKKIDELEDKKKICLQLGNKMSLSIYCRSAAKALSIALIKCASRLGPAVIHGAIELEDITWAWALVDECDQRMIEQGQASIAQSRFQALCQKIMKAVTRKSLECQQKKSGVIGATLRDVLRSIKTDIRKDVESAIDTLEHQGRLCETVIKAKNGHDVVFYQIAEIVPE